MESLITGHSKNHRTITQGPDTKKLSTTSSVPSHVKDYMDFMAGLPLMYKDFQEDGTLVGQRDLFSQKENLEGESPYPAEIRQQHRKLKIDLNNPIVKNVITSINNLKVNPSDKNYLITLGSRESSLNPNATQGSFRGLYQFNKDSLKVVGIPMTDYKKDINKQNLAALRYKEHNLKLLKDYRKYIGIRKDGTIITENGMAAAAHLLGAGTVMDYLSNTRKTKLAQNGFKDGLGTHISEYFDLFA